jgi:hypothetical protein
MDAVRSLFLNGMGVNRLLVSINPGQQSSQKAGGGIQFMRPVVNILIKIRKPLNLNFK